MTYECPKCGLHDAESICAAEGTLICTGMRLESGCGRVLTAEERHYYGFVCETCTREWDGRVDAWRAGSDDPALDELFDARPKLSS